MGCGCGGKKFSPSSSATTQRTVNSNSAVPAQVQRAVYAGADGARVAQSQATPYRGGKTIVRRVV